MDHVVLVLFENRSFDNLLVASTGQGTFETFEGVIARTSAIPFLLGRTRYGERARPLWVSDNMDAPDPDPGEEYQHTNTQLFNLLDEANRFKDAGDMVAPHNAPPAGTQSTMRASSPTTSAS